MDTYLAFVTPVLTVLWSLICLRIYTMISVENPGQRRLIAICGAVGAALIYVLASHVVAILKAPIASDVPPADESRVRVQARP
ncbi:MAG: hypothetical protein ABL974_22425 [Prosthecobacter sp.]